MKLEGKISDYTGGSKPTHCVKANLGKYMKAWDQEEVEKLLSDGGYLNSETGKLSKATVQDGIVDLCEGKPLWNILKTQKTLIRLHQSAEVRRANEIERKRKMQEMKKETSWVDLGVIGTYFGVSAIVVGRWLDALGLRVKPTLEKNSSGAYDMLDVARQEQQKQASGFIGKKPTEKAYGMGLAREITVTDRKKKEIQITQWNLQLAKAVLVKAGHPLDTEKKMILKGKGKNSDVKVESLDDRAKKMYAEWQKLFRNSSTREESWKIFDKQPTPLLSRVEELMGKPRYLQDKKYLKSPF